MCCAGYFLAGPEWVALWLRVGEGEGEETNSTLKGLLCFTWGAPPFVSHNVYSAVRESRGAAGQRPLFIAIGK